MLKSKNGKNILRIEMGVIAPALHPIQIKLNYAHECSQIITSSYGKAKGFSFKCNDLSSINYKQLWPMGGDNVEVPVGYGKANGFSFNFQM